MAFVSAAGGTPSLGRSNFVQATCTSLPVVTPSPPRCISLRSAIRMQGPARSTVCDTPLKTFLDSMKPLGKTRIVVRNTAGIMEAVAPWDSLFFATIPTGEYANLIDHKLNLDMHLLLGGVTGARFDVGVARTPSKAPTYAIRFLGHDKETVVLSVFVQWDKDPEDIAPERIDAWKSLKDHYAGTDKDTFFFEPLSATS